jgi:hypothetical protein
MNVVFFGSAGATYQRQPVPAGTVLIQYADPFSGYGPFAGGPEGLDFFSQRDRMAGFVATAGPSAVVTGPSPAGTGGQFYCVVGGFAQVDGRTYRVKSLAWVPPDGAPLTMEAGADGLQAVVLQFPEPSLPPR